VAQSLILFMAGIMALGELDISTQIFSFSFLVLLGVAGIAAAVAFGLGTRSVVEQLAAGQGLRQCLQPGEVIQYDCHEGTIEAVGYTHINLRTDQGIVVIPNTVMLNATIIKRRSIAATPVTTHTSKAKQPV
jgi:small-conductance mechanosensitive channel